jgi:hypothetical protein
MMRWYAVVNDLVGGWAVSAHDKPLSEHDFRIGQTPLAELYDEDDARAVAALLNLHGYVPKRVVPPAVDAEALG